MDWRQVAGHWIAIALSIILFNLGIAIASFFTVHGQQEWRIIGASVLGTAIIMLIIIPFLIRRNIRSRYREAFRSLPEAEFRRKRCGGHTLAWLLSAVHFILGITITSFASDIRSKGWVVVGLFLLVMGLVSMICTAVFIYASLRERVPVKKGTRRGMQADQVVSKDTTQTLFPMTTVTDQTLSGFKRKMLVLDTEMDVNANLVLQNTNDSQCMERRWQSNPDIYGDLTSDSSEGNYDFKGASKTCHRPCSDIADGTVLQIKNEQMIELSKMLDRKIPNWKLLGHKIAANHRCKLSKYKRFLKQIEDCGKKPHSSETNTALCNSSHDKSAPLPLEDREGAEQISCNASDMNGMISADSNGGIYIIDVCTTDQDFINATPTSTCDSTDNDVTSQLCWWSPTAALFDLFKQYLPNLTLKEICYTLRNIGREDVARYIEVSYLKNITENRSYLLMVD